MRSVFMRLQYRRSLSFFLLATFAGISLLGEGLHWLTPDTELHVPHHHHHGVCIVMHGATDDDHDVQLVDSAQTSLCGAECRSSSKRLLGIASVGGFDAHVCKICEFLVQAISQSIELAAPFEWHPLTVSFSSLRR